MLGTQLPYPIQVQVILSLCWIFYRALLQRETFFSLSRAYLLGSVALAFILPLLRIPFWSARVVEVPGAWEATFTVSEAIEPVVVETAGTDPSGWLYALAAAGSLGLLAFSMRNLLPYLRRMRNPQNEAPGIGRIRLFETPGQGTAYSLFGRIFIDFRELDARESAQVLRHEMAHIRLGHSWDMLLAETVRIALWWNPLVWLWHRSLREVHEFQADRAVLEADPRSEQYIALMVRSCGALQSGLVSGFSYSLLRNRLRMIAARRSGFSAGCKALGIIPLVGGLLLLFSFTRAQTVYRVTSEGIPQQTDEALFEPEPQKPETPNTSSPIPRYRQPQSAEAQKLANEIRQKVDGEMEIYLDGERAPDNLLDTLDVQRVESMTVLKNLTPTRVDIRTKAPQKATPQLLIPGSVTIWNEKGPQVYHLKENSSLGIILDPRKTQRIFARVPESVKITLDRKRISLQEMNALDPQTLELVILQNNELFPEGGIELVSTKTVASKSTEKQSETPEKRVSIRPINGDFPEKALVFLDGRQISEQEILMLDPKLIGGITVLKEQHPAGRIEITSKKVGTAQRQAERESQDFGTLWVETKKGPKEAQIFLDGRRISQRKMNALDPQTIGSLRVLNDKTSRQVVITSKNAEREKYAPAPPSTERITIRDGKNDFSVKIQDPSSPNGGDSGEQQVQVFVDGRQIGPQEMGALSPAMIESMKVLKDENSPAGRIEISTKKAAPPASAEGEATPGEKGKPGAPGEKGKPGGIVVTTRKNSNLLTSPIRSSSLSGIPASRRVQPGIQNPKETQVFLDGRQISQQEMSALDPRTIESMTVQKNHSIQGCDMVEITSKKALLAKFQVPDLPSN